MAGFLIIFLMKIAVFIDGSNLYSKLKELKIISTSKFDYWGFIKFLTKSAGANYIGYYVGQIRKEPKNPKSEKLYADQQKIFVHLQSNISGIQIVRGHIQNFNGIYKEKGVDVRLALDLYKLANEDLYDKAILISSDSDLIPSIKMVKELKKEVEYIGFSPSPSIALLKECNIKRLLTYDDLLPFEHKK
jgi:uncharacterized LabA/DUF88 family protein